MTKLGTLFRDLHEDKSGAAFIEYTVLLGVILAVAIGVITAVGIWASGRLGRISNTAESNPVNQTSTSSTGSRRDYAWSSTGRRHMPAAPKIVRQASLPRAVTNRLQCDMRKAVCVPVPL